MTITISTAPTAVTAPARLSLTRFRAYNAPKGTREACTWPELVARLRTPLPRTTPKDELPLWAPATFDGDYRDADNVETACMVGFDVDEEPVPTESDLRASLGGYLGVFYSTSSHRSVSKKNPKGTDRFRAMLVLSREVTGPEYYRVWRALARGFGFKVGASKDPSRQWYVPREPEHGQAVFGELTGAQVDVEVLLALEPAREDEVPVELPAEGTWSVTREQRDAFASLLAPAFVSGKRHHLTRVIFGTLARMGASQAEAHETLAWIADSADLDDPEDGETSKKRVRMCTNAFERASKGLTLEGRPTLVDLAGRHAVRALAVLDDEAIERRKPKLLEAYRERKRLEREAAEDKDAPKPSRTIADRVMALGSETSVRMATGFPTLDRITRGGLPTGKLLAIGGAPGAGKTALGVQWAFRWPQAGAHVGVLACDEDASGLLIRFGQLLGIERADLERGDAAAKSKLVEWVSRVHFTLWDSDEDEISLERASKDLRATAGDLPSVLLVDSLQTVRVDGAAGAGSPRERIDAVVRAAKLAAKVDRHLVVATSELARGAYRSRDVSESINDLAAFKESGGIEYALGLALVLRSRPDANGLVDVTVPKNRFGNEKTPFAIRLDFARAGVREDTLVAALDVGNVLGQYRDAIMNHRQVRSGAAFGKTALAELVPGKRANKLKAIDALIEEGKLFHAREGIRLPLPGDPVPVPQ